MSDRLRRDLGTFLAGSVDGPVDALAGDILDWLVDGGWRLVHVSGATYPADE